MNPPAARKPVHVIAHTHWDRSWYWPFERFRVRLVECVQAVLRELRADPDYRFQFDGQVLMLEDYLQACPEDRAYLQECARAGRVAIGPMYCLSDVYGTGGEALIRNLLIGRNWCEEFGGGYSRTLHMPDTFGIIPEIPMIAAGFGFQAFSFMRGVAGQVPGLVDMADLGEIPPQIPPDTRYFHWLGADGSRIPTLRLRHGYANAAASRFHDPDTGMIDYDRALAGLKEAAAAWDTPPHEVVLLMAGVDHMIPWDRQREALRQASAETGLDFRFSSLDAVSAHLATTDTRAWPICVNQEFHGSGAASVLGGTITARLWLKQTNARIEQLLTHQVEPAVAYCRLLGIHDPAFALLTHAWKTLLATHPHDDICGCSVDSVHRRNESDMEQAAECADALRRRAGFHLLRHFGGPPPEETRLCLVLINFQPRTRRGPVRIRLDFEGQRRWGDVRLPQHYRLVDEAGREVPCREIERRQSVEHPRQELHLELAPTLPPFRLQRFHLEEIPPAPEPSAGDFTAENEHLTVHLHPNGTFSLHDRATGATHHGLGGFTTQSDIGDSYDFSDLPGEEEVWQEPVCARERRAWPGGAVSLTARGTLTRPAEVDSATRTPAERWVALPFAQTLTLYPNARQVEVQIDFTNLAADHRLRWNLTLRGPAPHALAGLKFQNLPRPAGSQPSGDTAPRIFPEHPLDAFVAAGGLAVFSDFPRNYEVVNTPRPRLAITLFRSFSWLTNPCQGATRPGTHAGPHTFTPEGRGLGRVCRQHLALRPIGPEEDASLLAEALAWRTPPFLVQPDATLFVPPVHPRPAEPAFELLEGELRLSACKPAQTGEGVVLRLHNPFPGPQTARLRRPPDLALTPVNLAEEVCDLPGLEDADGVVTLTVPAFGLCSLRCRSAAPAGRPQPGGRAVSRGPRRAPHSTPPSVTR